MDINSIEALKKLTDIYSCIDQANAQQLESGEAIVSVEPIKFGSVSHFVVSVNGQPVYAPIADGKEDTYSACAEQLIGYMNSY